MGVRTTIKEPINLFEALLALYPQSPRTRIKKMLQHGSVFCNGKAVTQHSFGLKTGDVVEIKDSSALVKKETAPFTIIYEDTDVIAIDKPAGIATSDSGDAPNVYSMVSQYIKAQTKGQSKAFLVHRIDRDVSGVLLFAKSKKAADFIQAHWKEARKLYFALVEGRPEKPEGKIDSWLIEDGNFKVHSTHIISDKAQFAITHYRTNKQFEKNTLLEVELETGRKNQIRVHMADLGCPIVGDIKYGAAKGFGNRVRLHAFSLSFVHPATSQLQTVQAPMPKGFLNL